MSNNTSSIVSKVWSFCNPLRDVGVGYGDYLEQLTYLLFLKYATLLCELSTAKGILGQIFTKSQNKFGHFLA